MTKKENVRESLKALRAGYPIAFEWKYNGIYYRHFAKLSGKYIRVVGFGSWACKNTVKDWNDEFGKSRTFERLPKDFYISGL